MIKEITPAVQHNYPRYIEFIEMLDVVLQEWKDKTDLLPNLKSVDVDASFLLLLLESLGVNIDVKLVDEKKRVLLKQLKSIYDIKSSKKFFTNLSSIYGVKAEFIDMNDKVMKPSWGTGLSQGIGFQDGLIVRDGVLQVSLTRSDMNLIRDILDYFIPAGWRVIYTILSTDGNIGNVIISNEHDELNKAFETFNNVDMITIQQIEITLQKINSLNMLPMSKVKAEPGGLALGSQIFGCL